jgi:hypothetical protein
MDVDWLAVGIALVVDGSAYILGSSYAERRGRWQAVGACTAVAGLLCVASQVVGPLVSSRAGEGVGLAAGVCGMASLLGRYPITMGDYRGGRRWPWFLNFPSLIGMVRRMDRGTFHLDSAEAAWLSVLCVLTMAGGQAFGNGFDDIWTGVPRLLWVTAGLISIVRIWDPPAAVGIAGTPPVRLLLLWLVRVAMASAIPIWLAQHAWR